MGDPRYRAIIPHVCGSGQAQSARWKTVVTETKYRVRPKEITLTATSMKPNTRFWAFVDGKRCTENSQAVTGYVVSGSSTMRTDAKGNASLKIQIPKDNPYAEGELLIRICDSKTNTASLTTTAAEAIFTVGGVKNTTKEGVTSTRLVAAKRDTAQAERIVQDMSTLSTAKLSGVADYFDPLAQIFEIDSSQYGNGVFATSVDLFFREIDGDQIDDNNTGDPLPFSVELRPVKGGQPHPTVAVPLSFTTKDSGMTGSKNGPDLNTFARFSFSTPCYLAPGKYAILCKTNSTRYALWGTQYGMSGVTSDGTSTANDVERQPYVGNLLLPQNNGSRWTVANQNILFRVNRATFPTGTDNALYLEGATADAENEFGEIVETPDYHEVAILAQDMTFPNTTLQYFINTTDGEGLKKELQAYIPKELETKNTFDLTTQRTDQEQRAIHEANMGTLDENLTPVVDMDRLSTILTRMEFSNNTENELLPKAPTDYNTPISRYIGLVVDTGYEANIVRVSFHATRREGTGFKVYARTAVPADESMSEKPWVEMTGEVTNQSMPQTTEEPIGQRFYYEKPEGFMAYQIKIVLTGDNTKTKYSTIHNLKTFALYDPEIDITIGGVGDVYAAGEQASDEESGGYG